MSGTTKETWAAWARPLLDRLHDKGYEVEAWVVSPEADTDLGHPRQFRGIPFVVRGSMEIGTYGADLTPVILSEGFECSRCGLYTRNAASCPRCDGANP